jgi:hypothetical protein
MVMQGPANADDADDAEGCVIVLQQTLRYTKYLKGNAASAFHCQRKLALEELTYSEWS